MAIEDVLRRVEDDLARGHTFVAIQRLTSLVQANPKDLAVRSRLAEVHLATGNFVQAGRWSYLTDTRDERATAAFEKAYRDPRAREDALNWALDPDRDPKHAKDVLLQLHRDIELVAKRGRREDLLVRAGGPEAGDWGLAFVVLVCLGIFVLGVVTLIGWAWPG